MITFIILLIAPSWQAAALAQGNAVFTQEQSNRLTPGFAQQCAAEIAGTMSYALRNGMPDANGMSRLNYWVGFSKDRVQQAYNIARPGLEEDKTEYWRPINRYFYCQAGYVLAHWDDAASGNRSTTRPNATAKPAPKAVALAEKLPPARPAKMLPWSPKALPSNGAALDPQFAAERADIIASCTPALRQLAGSTSSTVAVALNFEKNWLTDKDMDDSADEMSTQIAARQSNIDSGKIDATRLATERLGVCAYQRRLAQLQGSPLLAGAIDGTLTPLSTGGQTPSWTRQGKDARIIASDGESAVDCVKLIELTKTDSRMGGGGRVLSNQCSGPVEIVWCISPNECERQIGNMWTVSAGRSWPVSANGEVRWAACHGANTAAHVKGSFGLRYYCSAPAKK